AGTGTATALAGTPAYMAPEQLEGARASTATDQFAYCVTPWEELHGRRPFVGTTVAELRAAMDGLPATRRRRGPITRALARGLAVDPAKRWASVHALVDVLERKRSRWIVPAVIGATAVVGVAIGFAAPSREARDPCPHSREAAKTRDPERPV